MDVRGDEPAPQERWPLAFRCAIAMAGGAAIVWNTRSVVDRLPDEPTTVDVSSWSYATVTVTFAVTVACAASVMALLVKPRWLRDALTILTVTAVGCALATVSSVQTSPFDSMRERPVTVIGVVASAARMDDGGTDRLSKYAIRSAAQSFVLRVNYVVGVDIPGEIDCEILVRVSGLAPLPARGMRVCVRGWYEPPSTTINPGSRARRATGSISTTSTTLVTHMDVGVVDSLMIRIRTATHRALSNAMPEWASPESRALVAAMTTGVRLPGLSRPSAEFRAAGMSHVLAISGFNVAVLIAACAGAAKLLHASSRWRAIIAMMVAVAFLAVTEPDTSVLRAGLGAGLAAIASIRGGQARGLGTLGLVALVTMLLDINAVAGAGFQLSYGVVIALLVITPRVHRRWDERTHRWWLHIPFKRVATSEAASIVRSSMLEALIAALVAWTVSTPIAVWHAGSMNGWAAPLSVITMPAAAITTIAGVAAIVTMDLAPPIGHLCGAMATTCAATLGATATMAASAPGGTWCTGRPDVWWTVVALIACVSAWIATGQTSRIIGWFVTTSLIVGLWFGTFRPFAQSPGRGEVFIESIAVGGGACHLIRTDTITVLVDAGTSGDSSAGSRRMVPALAALGVRRIDRLVIGSRSLAEVSGVPEVLLAFKVGAVVMDTRCLAAFRGARDGFPTDVLHAISERKIPIFSVVDKQLIEFGNMSMQAIVPPPNPAARHDNGGLMVEIRHRDWLPTVKPVLVSGDPKLAARAQLLTTTAPNDCAVRTIVDDSRRLHLQLWTIRGWK